MEDLVIIDDTEKELKDKIGYLEDAMEEEGEENKESSTTTRRIIFDS